MRTVLVASLAFLSAGCATKTALMGNSGNYTDLPTPQPAQTYAEVLCPGEEAEEGADPLTEKMFLTEEGAVWTWMGGDSAYVTEHDFGQWTYEQDDPAVTLWLAMADTKPTSGGSGIFYLESLGGGMVFGNLVLLPSTGDVAYRFLYLNRTKVKWKLDKIDDSVRVKPIPESVPMSIYCFDGNDAGWPETMEPPTSLFMYGVGLETRALYAGGDVEGAKALLAKNDLMNKLRYADAELDALLTHWKFLTDESIPGYPLIKDPSITNRETLWAAIEAKYDGLVAEGKAPARAGTEPEAPAEAEAPADTSTPAEK